MRTRLHGSKLKGVSDWVLVLKGADKRDLTYRYISGHLFRTKVSDFGPGHLDIVMISIDHKLA